jgi:hypothetical protein
VQYRDGSVKLTTHSIIQESPCPIPGIASLPHIIANPLSDYALERVRFRISQCMKGHLACNSDLYGDQAYPSRLLDIGNPENTSIRLVSVSERHKYFTLSYCWGTGNPLRTTKANKASMEANISWNALPKSVQDAVQVTRALGSRYLWIDSLCILQDDGEDWETESAKMGDIYGASELTLMASRAASCDESFLQLREEGKCVLSCLFQERYLEVWSRAPVDHNSPLSTVPSPFHECPIFRRGWCFQERLLSRRVLHFAQNEIFFQCRTEDWCECSGNMPWNTSHSTCNTYYAPTVLKSNRSIADNLLEGGRGGQSNDAREENYPDDNTGFTGLMGRICFPRVTIIEEGDDVPAYFGEVWGGIVSEYCDLALSFTRDTLPALSGIAKMMFELQHSGRYFGGIWERDIHYFLAWSSVRDLGQCLRHKEYIAPSFSWASRTGPVIFPGGGRLITSVCTVVEARTMLKGKNPYGEVQGGSITLRGKLISTTLDRDKNHSRPPFLDTEEDDIFFDEVGRKEFYCFELYRHVYLWNAIDNPDVQAIVLVRVNHSIQPRIFRRIGITFGSAASFDSAPLTTITIV